MKIELSGRIPSKKNSKRFMFRGGRPILISSEAYLQWHEEMSWRLKKYPRVFTKNRVSVEIKIWAPDARKSDLTNKAESLMDLLVDVGIITDDNWDVVPEVILLYQGMDRVNPRCEINIIAI